MSRPALFVAVFAGLLLSSPAWALPQSPWCRSANPARKLVPLDSAVCLLVQDPWQDCDEDPWQLSTAAQPDTFADPWQDDGDPWQPVFATSPSSADANLDPWQPVMSQVVPPTATARVLDAAEDPWQPPVLDPWQDGPDDPWQVP